MIRRWGFVVFFLLALLLAAGAWVGSYWRDAGGYHYSARTGVQQVYVCRGAMGVVSGDGVADVAWGYWNYKVDHGLAALHEEHYRVAPYRFLGFAYNPDEKALWVQSDRRLIIPLWFPTLLSALGLLWAWRRKRKRDRTRRGGFEVQHAKPQA